LVDDLFASHIVTPLGGVRDRVAHIVQTALVEQVDDQLQLVHALGVGHLGLVASLDQRLKASLDQRRDAAAQYRLLAKQVGLGLLGEGGQQHAGLGRAN